MKFCTWCCLSYRCRKNQSGQQSHIRGTLPFIQCELNVIKEEDGGEWHGLELLTLKIRCTTDSRFQWSRQSQSQVYDQLTTYQMPYLRLLW